MSTRAEIMMRVQGSAKAAKDIDQVSRSVDRTEKSTDRAARVTGRFTGGLHRLRSTALSAAKGAIAFTGALAVFSQLKSSVSTTQTLEKNVMALGRTMNASDREIGQWSGILASRNIDVGKFGMGMTRLGDQVMKARAGNRDAARLLRDIGVSSAALRSGNTPRILSEIADGYKAMPDKMQRAAILQKIFGRTAKDLAPLLSGGSAALKEQTRLMDKYGVTAAVGGHGTRDLIKGQREFQIAMLGFQLTIGQKVIPVMVTLMGTVTRVMQNLRSGKGGWEILRGAAQGIVEVIQDVVWWFQKSKTATRILTVAFIAFAAAMGIVKLVNLVTAGILALNLALNANPIGLVVAAIAGLVGGLVVLYKKSEAFRGAVNRLWDTAKVVFGFLAGAWDGVVSAANKAWELLSPIFDRIVGAFEKVKSAVDWIGSQMPGQASSTDAAQLEHNPWPLRSQQTGTPAPPAPVAPVSVPRAKLKHQNELGTSLARPVVHEHHHYLDGREIAVSTVSRIRKDQARR